MAVAPVSVREMRATGGYEGLGSLHSLGGVLLCEAYARRVVAQFTKVLQPGQLSGILVSEEPGFDEMQAQKLDLAAMCLWLKPLREKQCGCPVVGRIARTRDGSVKESLTQEHPGFPINPLRCGLALHVC